MQFHRICPLTNSDNQTTGGADNFTGGAGTDSFLATANNAFDNGDVVNGGAGTDTLTARYSLVDDKTVSGSVTNVEVIKIDLDDGDIANNETLTFSVAGATGLTSVAVVDAASTTGQEDTVNVTGIASGVALGITNGDANTIVDFDFSDTTSLTDTATLTLNAAKADAVIIAGIETVTVDATSGTSTLDTITLDSATKMVITGSGKLTVSAMTAALLEEFDGSAATGNVSIAGFIAGDVSVAGGSGNDTFNFTANGVGVADTVSGGTGTDRLVAAAAQTTALTNVSGVEELAFKLANTADAAVEISAAVLTGLTTVVIDAEDDNDGGAGATITVSNLSDTQSVVVENASAENDGTDDIRLTLTSATDTTTNVANVTLQGIGAVAAGASTTGISTITVDNIETVTLTASANTANTVTTNGVEALAASGTKTLAISGAADLTITAITNTTALTSVNASAATGKFSISGLDASALNFTAGSGQTTIDMAGLNATDTVTGGASTKDQLTATAVTGLTATTGKLNVTGVETVRIQATGANTIDASLMTGVTTLSFSGATPGTQTVTGLAAGVAIGVGDAVAAFDNGDIVSVALADSTGTADSLTFKVNNTVDANTDVDLKSSGIENVTISVLDDDTGNDMTVDMTAVAATTITVTGGFAGAVLALDTLEAGTTTLTTTAYKGDVTFSAANATAAMTVSTAAATGASSFTLSGKDDTITIAETGAVSVVLAGGAGNDTLNLSVKAGFIDADEISAVEYVNLAVRAGDDITLGAGADELNGLDEATKLTATGGNELSTLTLGGATDTFAGTTLKSVDASAFQGNIALVYDADALTEAFVIEGGALTTDSVTASYNSTGDDNAYALTGIETLNLTLDSGNDGAETYTADLASTSGLKTLAIATGTTGATTAVVDNYAATTTVQLGIVAGTSAVNGASNIDINLASSTGTADTINLKLVDTADAVATVDVDAAGVEILNITVSTAAESHKLNLAGVTATTDSTVTINLTGGVAGDILTITDVAETARVISAADLAVNLTISDRGASAMTITGGTGADSIRMENTSDVLDGGADAGDTLVIVQNAILGGFAADLSSTVDQVTTYNGSANSAVQKGFLSINLSGITGVFGADVTANSVGSTITGTSSNDQITGGAGSDIIVFAATAATNGSDVVLSFAAADAFNFSAFATDNTFAVSGEVTDASTGDIATSTVDGSGIITNSILLVLDADGGFADTAAAVAGLFDDGTDGGQAFETVDANANVIVIVRDTTNSQTKIYYVDNDGTAAVATSEVTLVGTLTGYSTAFVDANIVN